MLNPWPLLDRITSASFKPLSLWPPSDAHGTLLPAYSLRIIIATACTLKKHMLLQRKKSRVASHSIRARADDVLRQKSSLFSIRRFGSAVCDAMTKMTPQRFFGAPTLPLPLSLRAVCSRERKRCQFMRTFYLLNSMRREGARRTGTLNGKSIYNLSFTIHMRQGTRHTDDKHINMALSYSDQVYIVSTSSSSFMHVRHASDRLHPDDGVGKSLDCSQADAVEINIIYITLHNNTHKDLSERASERVRIC